MPASRPAAERRPEPVRLRAFRTILVVAGGTAEDESTLSRALSLAGEDACHLGVLLCLPDERPQDWVSRIFGPTVAALNARKVRYLAEGRALDDRIAGFARRHRLACGDVRGARWIGRTAEQATPWLAMRRELPLADVVVVGGDAARRPEVRDLLLADALITARVPLYIARRVFSRAPPSVAIAWDASWTAGRAVRAALPLLVRAREIVVLQGRKGLSPRQRDAGVPQDLADYLRREGAERAPIWPVAVTAGPDALLTAVRAAGSELLVMGAFGRPRWIERLFGGVTHRLLEAEPGPDLFLTH